MGLLPSTALEQNIIVASWVFDAPPSAVRTEKLLKVERQTYDVSLAMYALALGSDK